MEGIKDIADGGLHRCPAVEQCLLQPGVEAPDAVEPEHGLRDIRGSVILGKICRPSAAQLKIVLRNDSCVEDIQVDDLPGAEIGFIQGIEAVDIYEGAIPFILEGVADVETKDILAGEIDLRIDRFGAVGRIRNGCEKITDMTIAQGSRQRIFISPGEAQVIGVFAVVVGCYLSRTYNRRS